MLHRKQRASISTSPRSRWLTSIRTRSVNTARRLEAIRATRRHVRVILTALWCLAGLSACASGNADSANEAATREAKQATNVVGNIEATQVVREFFAETATPSPYPTVLPSLANLRLTTSLRDQDAPGETVHTYFRGSGPLYADAQIANVFPGQRVVAVWSQGGNTLQTTEVNIENPRELVWVALRWDIPSSAPSGTYTVSILVAGPGTNDEGTPADVSTEIGSVVFQVQ
jgi:hypothetical protein